MSFVELNRGRHATSTKMNVLFSLLLLLATLAVSQVRCTRVDRTRSAWGRSRGRRVGAMRTHVAWGSSASLSSAGRMRCP